MVISRRETIEWTNEWWENANLESVERWVLVGDSVARQIRGSIQNLVPNVCVDFFASSFAMEDDMFEKRIKNFFEIGYQYEIAIVNYGMHHGLNSRTADSQEVWIEYYHNYFKLVEFLLSKCRKVVLVSGTHHEININGVWELDEEINKEIETRNRILSLLAEECEILYINLYSFFKNNRQIYPHADHIHFSRMADDKMSSMILQSMGYVFEQEVEDMVNAGCKVSGMRQLEGYIHSKKPCVIFGCKKRGENIEKYIKARGGKVIAYMVSDEVAIEEFVNILLPIYHVSEIPFEETEFHLILSTDNKDVKNMLNKRGMSFVEPGIDVFKFIDTYNDIFIEGNENS